MKLQMRMLALVVSLAAAASFAQDAVLGPAPRLAPGAIVSQPPSAAVIEGGTMPLATVPPIDTSNRAAVAAAYNQYWNVAMPTLGWTGSIASCNPGSISAAFQDWTMTRINFARAMAGVPGTTTLNAGLNAQQQATALLMAASGTINHFPPASSPCYSASGAEGAASSNLAYGPIDSLPLYLSDIGNPEAGHRRWILDSSKGSFGLGQANGQAHSFNAMYVFDQSQPRSVPNGIAWPPRGYVPLALFPDSGYWSFGLPNAEFGMATVSVTRNGVPVGVTVVSRDANGYGDNTIVWQMPAGQAIPETSYQVTISNVIGTASSQYTYEVRPFDPNNSATTKGDLNGDRRSDILYRNFSTGQVYRMLMNDFAVIDDAVVHHEPDLGWGVSAQGDLNGDGYSDLVWRHSSTGQVYVMLFGANGRPAGGAMVWADPNPAWRIVLATDLNGDRRDDLVWWNSATGQVYVMVMGGAVILQHGFAYREPDTRWRIVAAGDFTGGGVAQHLVWHNSATGQVYFQTLNVVNGGFTTSGLVVYQAAGTSWKIVGAPDLNGDGRSDLLWRNDSTGEVYSLLMNGNSIIGQGTLYREPNLAWKIVATGDYDGDGRYDLLWRNESTGEAALALVAPSGLGTSVVGRVYSEPNLAWRILGPYEYAK
jgi:hypothetical protein